MRTLAIIVSGLALFATTAATIYLSFAPLYQHVEIVHTETGQETIRGTATLLEVNGARALIQLSMVVLVSGVPLFAALKQSGLQRLLTWVSALLLMAYSMAGSFTIGLAFMPSAILLLIAALATLFIPKDGDQSVVDEP